MKIEVCIEGVNDIIRSDLSEVLKNLQDDLNRRKKGQQMAIFHVDKKKDIAQLKKHIDALKLVLRYYGAA